MAFAVARSSETGFYYYRARYYSADIGRFLSRDPIGTADQVNPYAYVANNPLKYVDPMGREKALIYIWRDWQWLWMPSNALVQAANTQYDIFLSQGYKAENIIVRFWNTIQNFNDSIWAGYYGNVALVAHSNQNWVHLDYYNDDNASTISSSTINNLTNLSGKDASLTIIGCMSWYWDNSIAEQIANQLWITVSAPNSSIVPSSEGFLNWGLGGNLWDKTLDAIEYGIFTTPATFVTF